MALGLSRLPSRAPCGGSAWDCPTSASTPEGGRDAPGANPAHSILRPARHAHLYAWQGLWQFSQVSAATRFLAERRLTLLGSVVSILACLFSRGLLVVVAAGAFRRRCSCRSRPGFFIDAGRRCCRTPQPVLASVRSYHVGLWRDEQETVVQPGPDAAFGERRVSPRGASGGGRLCQSWPSHGVPERPTAESPLCDNPPDCSRCEEGCPWGSARRPASFKLSCW